MKVYFWSIWDFSWVINQVLRCEHGGRLYELLVVFSAETACYLASSRATHNALHRASLFRQRFCSRYPPPLRQRSLASKSAVILNKVKEKPQKLETVRNSRDI